MRESLFNKVAGRVACFPVNFAKCFTEQLRWLPLIILDYIIFHQTRTAHPLSRRITTTLYKLSQYVLFHEFN